MSSNNCHSIFNCVIIAKSMVIWEVKILKKIHVLISFLLLFLTLTPAYAQDDATGAAFGLIGCLCWGLFFLLWLAAIVFWVMMIVDVVKRPDDQFPNPSDNTKIVWILIVILLNWIGALVYYFMVKKKMGS